MGKHHTEDYKLSAVKYALRTDNQVETCEVFDCKRSSLQEWIDLYQKTGSPVRKTRKNRIAYKVHQEHIDFLRTGRLADNLPNFIKIDSSGIHPNG